MCSRGPDGVEFIVATPTAAGAGKLNGRSEQDSDLCKADQVSAPAPTRTPPQCRARGPGKLVEALTSPTLLFSEPRPGVAPAPAPPPVKCQPGPIWRVSIAVVKQPFAVLGHSGSCRPSAGSLAPHRSTGDPFHNERLLATIARRLRSPTVHERRRSAAAGESRQLGI